MKHKTPAEQLEADIETLMRDLRTYGEWEDHHEDILARWRERRGEDGKTAWRWWWRLPDDELYQTDHATREEAVAAAIRAEHDETIVPEICLIEARGWSDDVLAGDDVECFAETRNAVRITLAAND